MVRLVVALVALLAAAIETRTPARSRRDAPTVRDTTSRPAPALLRLVMARPAAPTTPAGTVAPTASERLASPRRGLGFAPRDVGRVVGQLGPRVELEPLQTLIPECLRVLTPAALAG